jgi:hypothetical protein
MMRRSGSGRVMGAGVTMVGKWVRTELDKTGVVGEGGSGSGSGNGSGMEVEVEVVVRGGGCGK